MAVSTPGNSCLGSHSSQRDPQPVRDEGTGQVLGKDTFPHWPRGGDAPAVERPQGWLLCHCRVTEQGARISETVTRVLKKPAVNPGSVLPHQWRAAQTLVMEKPESES